MTEYGFIGLGIMGSAMAANLVKAGFGVTVWNRSADKCAPLVALGARQATSAKEVVAGCSITFAMLSDPAAAEAVCFAPDGVLEGLKAGKAYVDLSTVDEACSRRISDAVTERGGRFLEAPVSGSKKPAEDGTLIILAAGDRGLYDEVKAAFDCMGKASHFLGEVGQGARMKLLVNMVMGGMMAIFSEGLALGEKGGLDPGAILEVLSQGALANPMFALKGPNMLEENFSTHFPLKHMQKDLRLAIGLGDSLAQPLCSASAANETFKRARAMGLEDFDFSAVIQAIRQKRE